MDTVRILKMEALNRNCIYLHREGSEWYAYEFSAFYLISAFQVGSIERLVDNTSEVCFVRLPLGRKPQDFFAGQELISCGEDMVKVKCKLKYGGFKFWKSLFLN